MFEPYHITSIGVDDAEACEAFIRENNIKFIQCSFYNLDYDLYIYEVMLPDDEELLAFIRLHYKTEKKSVNTV